MKYRIRKITRKNVQGSKPVEASSLYDFGIFCEKDETDIVLYKKKESLFHKLFLRISAFTHMVRRTVRASVMKMRERFLLRKENKMLLPALYGAILAATLVTAVSFGIVGYKLFFADRLGGYTIVYVPDLVDTFYPENTAVFDSELYEIEAAYEYSDDIPAGKVITQTPAPNLMRRVYARRGGCKVDIVVSLGKKSYTMPALEGISLRDASLVLKNGGVRFKIEKQYSDSVERGKVISTFPDADVSFFADQTVTLTVSSGARTVYKTAPELIGMSESAAREVVSRMGLKLSGVNYEPSELPYGTVISQTPAPYSRVKDNDKISLRVSAGQKYPEKKIPSLYGLTVDEAREKLSLVGLVIGNIYAVAHAAPKGTVVAQSLLPELPLPSDVYSVDVYVSS